MCARIIPFPTLDADGVDALIERARLSQENKIIAKAYLNGEKIVDIATLQGVHMERSAVGKRIKNEIMPELERTTSL